MSFPFVPGISLAAQRSYGQIAASLRRRTEFAPGRCAASLPGSDGEELNDAFRSLALAAAAALALATPAVAGPAEDFKAVADEYWASFLRANPTYASQIGHREYRHPAGRRQPRRRPTG